MKKSDLEHSFDKVRLSDQEKGKILNNINNKKSSRARQLPLKPLVGMALLAVLAGGILLASQFTGRFRQTAGTPGNNNSASDTGTTTAAFTTGTAGSKLKTAYPIMVSLSPSHKYPINTEQWKEIGALLDKAVLDPGITGIDLDLRPNDLEFTGEDGSKLMIREFREIYLTSSESFAAFHLQADDSLALKSLLIGIMDKTIPNAPALTDPHDKIHELMTQIGYSISRDQWDEIAQLLSKSVPDPQINGVRQDLREHDFEFTGTDDNRILIREFREVYLIGPDFFAAYHLTEADSQALETLLENIMGKPRS